MELENKCHTELAEVSQTQIPKGYKQTEVGLIPEDWEVATMRSLTTLMTNGFVGTAKSQYTEERNGVLYIQGYNVKENAFNFNGIKRVNPEFHKRNKKSNLKEGDLLTVQTGDVGLTTIVPKALEGSNCHALIISRFKKNKAYPWYYTQYFNSIQGRARLVELETGTTMKHINVGELQHWLVPLPPTLAEQKAIATALSDVDDLIISLDTLIAKKKAIKQGAMQQLLTPPSKGGKRLDGFDGEWVETNLGDVCDIRKGQLITESTRTDGPIPVIAGGKKAAYYHANANRFGKTITISGSGANAGYVGFHNYPIFASDCSTIEESTKYSIEFIYFLLSLMQKQIYNAQTGGAQPHIHPSDMNPMEVGIPKVDEQKAIAQILSDMDKELEELATKKEKYEHIKQGMMQELLTGKTRLV